MFIFLQNVKSDEAVSLHHPIDNTNSNLKIILHEMLYTVNWTNINHDNNWISINNKRHEINFGYYDFCRLSEELFKPHGIDAKMNPANLRVTLTFNKAQHGTRPLTNLILAPGLYDILGFERGALFVIEQKYWDGGRQHISFGGDKPMNLAVNKRLHFYLRQLNTTENLVNGSPSTLLKIVSSEKESYCDQVTHSFLPQKKILSHDYHPNLSFKITNQSNQVVDFDDLTLVLEITN